MNISERTLRFHSVDSIAAYAPAFTPMALQDARVAAALTLLSNTQPVL